MQLLEDFKQLEELPWLRKKIESLTSNFTNLKSPEEGGISKGGVSIESNSKYLEVSYYNEMNRITNREIEHLKIKIDENKKINEEIMNIMKYKVSEKDMKALDEILNSKIDELKLNSHRKFADKGEISKSIKYLDAQVC